MQFMLPKERPIPDLNAVVSGINAVAEGRLAKAKALAQLQTACVSLVESETPLHAQMVSYSLDPLRVISACEESLSQCERRFKEDLQDIIERYAVVMRIKKSYDDAILEIEKHKNAVKEIETSLQLSESKTHKQKLIDNLQTAKVNRNESIQRAIELTKELIDAKKRFERFKVNRLKHGWKVYAEQLYKSSISEYDLYQSISNSLADVRSRIEVDNRDSEPQAEAETEQQTVDEKIEEIANPFESFKL